MSGPTADPARTHTPTHAHTATPTATPTSTPLPGAASLAAVRAAQRARVLAREAREAREARQRHSKLRLGVNESTGRLQWCPGVSCCKFLSIIPVVLLPAVLVLTLLLRTDGKVLPHDQQGAQGAQPMRAEGVAGAHSARLMWPTQDELQPLTDAERIRRCLAFNFRLSETLDAEERDILRDARTSFLSQEMAGLPRECLEPLAAADSTPQHASEAANRLRARRHAEPQPTAVPASQGGTDQDEKEQEQEEPEPEPEGDADPEGDPDADAGLKHGDSVAGVRSSESDLHAADLTASLQSFWNEQGTKQSIRQAQANTMKRYIDASIDPCDDFYKFACGNWERLHPIPRDKAGFDTFEMLRENLDAVLKQLLESPDKGSEVQLQRNHMYTPEHEHEHEHGSYRGDEDPYDVEEEERRKAPTSSKQTAAHPTQPDADDEADTEAEAQAEPDAEPEPEAEANAGGDEANKKPPAKSEAEARAEMIALRQHIVLKRHALGRLLERFRRHTHATNTKRKRLISSSAPSAASATTTGAGSSSSRASYSEDAARKAKQLYQSCINTAVLQQRGIEPLLQLIDSLGGWPVLARNWDEHRFDWLDLAARLRRFNNDILLVQWVGPDIKNSDENVIQFDQTSLGLPTREYFLQDTNARYLQAYQRFMAEVMNRLGATRELAQRTASDIVSFETQLASITSPAEERLNVTKLYKRMTLKQLHTTIPDINWKRYLTILQQRSVADNEEVVLYALDYMQDLVGLLQQSRPRTVANYMIWRFVRHRINNVDNRFEDIKQNFYHTLFGREESPSRWKVCIAQVNTNMGMALGSMFVRRYFDENSKRDTMRMTHELQQAFRDILKGTDWIDASTKRLAALKVNAMSLKIGYPDFILNPRELNEKYAGIEIDPERYFENTLNVLLHTAKTEQAKLHESVNKTTWQTAPAIVNAYYSRNKNQIMFPAGILQPPFYHRHFPRSLNFGGIGVVIGHELTHGFDDKGRLFDRNGSIHKWWTDESIKGFDERARCIIAQYNNYTVSEVGITINGESTQGENIADNGGIRQAFHAYKRWLRDNPQLAADERLPGLNMSAEQLFFLNFGQVWCGAMRPEAVRNKLNTAIHSPGRFRVIGTLSNSVDFAREFQCPLGSPMNPPHKCSVW